MATDFAATVNTGGFKAPFQGYDVTIWVVDQATGKQKWAGEFTSCQVTIQRTTQKYLEFNQTIEANLDGIFKIDWVLEKGQLDYNILREVFGFESIGREYRINRSPRFMINFAINAPELEEAETNGSSLGGSPSAAGNTFNTGLQSFGGITASENGGDNSTSGKRISKGVYRLTQCKVEQFVMGAVAGESVVANRWEGMAEGYALIGDKDLPWAGTSLSPAQQAGIGVSYYGSLQAMTGFGIAEVSTAGTTTTATIGGENTPPE